MYMCVCTYVYVFWMCTEVGHFIFKVGVVKNAIKRNDCLLYSAFLFLSHFLPSSPVRRRKTDKRSMCPKYICRLARNCLATQHTHTAIRRYIIGNRFNSGSDCMQFIKVSTKIESSTCRAIR